MKKSTQSAPEALSVEARSWWKRLAKEYDISDEAGLLLLQTALEAFDRMRTAQAAIAEDGVTIKDRWGQVKQHPLLAVERDSRAGMLAAIKSLSLDLEPLHARPGRPPGGGYG